MKPLLISAFLGTTLVAAVAQERIPADKTQAIAHKLVESLGSVADAQIKIDADADHGDAMAKDGAGALVIPDKQLTTALIEKAGKELVPVGELFFKDIAPARDGKVAPVEKLRTLTITDKNEEHHVSYLLLGIRKTGDRLELVAFGNDKAPLLVLPLGKLENRSQDLPIEISVENQGDDSADMALSILGKYKATFVVKKSGG